MESECITLTPQTEFQRAKEPNSPTRHTQGKAAETSTLPKGSRRVSSPPRDSSVGFAVGGGARNRLSTLRNSTALDLDLVVTCYLFYDPF